MEFVQHIADAYPSATVVCADSAVSVGHVSSAPGEAGADDGDDAALPHASHTTQPNCTVYHGPFVFLGSSMFAVGTRISLRPVDGGTVCSRHISTSPLSAPDSHVYVYPAVPVPMDGVDSGGSAASAAVKPHMPRPFSVFRVWAARVSTRPLTAEGEPVPGAPPTSHAMSHDGPCVSNRFDDRLPVDELLTRADVSSVVCVDLQLEAPLTSCIPLLRASNDALASLACPWVTRRCAASRAHVRPVGIADACLHWQEWAHSLLVNRLRWAYAVTVRSENPGDASSLWPERHNRRGSLLFEPSAGSLGMTEASTQGWGGTRRASILAAQMPPKYRQLERLDVPAEPPSTVWSALAQELGREDLLHPSAAGADAFDSIDIAVDEIPLAIPVLHRKRVVAGGTGLDAIGTAHGREFAVVDLGDDGGSAAGASGAVLGTERVVAGSVAAEVVFAAVMDLSHPKLSFACGMRSIRLLLNDYRYPPCV